MESVSMCSIKNEELLIFQPPDYCKFIEHLLGMGRIAQLVRKILPRPMLIVLTRPP